jgi:hypothetical protein
VELHQKVTTRVAGDFLRALIRAVPYKVHTVLTDHGIPFTTPGNTASAASLIKEALERGEPVWAHAFQYACAQNDIDHRLTKPKHQRPARADEPDPEGGNRPTVLLRDP